MEKQNKSCLSFDDIQRYVNNWEEMSYDEIYNVSDHLYDCDKCSELARSVRLFDLLWEQWTADAHGVAVKWMNGKETLSIGDKGMVEQTRKRILAAVRVICKAPGEVVSFLAESVEDIIGCSPELKFSSYAGTRGKGSPGQLHNSVISVSESGNVVLFAKGSSNSLTVRLEGFSNSDDLEVVLQAEGQEPLMAEIAPDREWEGCWHAVFSNIPLGEYILLIKFDNEIK
ncbi:MAG: hypothetical protein A4E55_02436 [Pelotomaculum sp. PtaU1.Bin035]|nr:MAG: hypothetical protein A4E55_02436 [Pelotomaculum sp. PtaU1.Bin035]